MSNLLQRKLLAASPDAHISSYVVTDWSSISFDGERHQITLRFDEYDKGLEFVQSLEDEVEFDLDYEGTKVCQPYLTELLPIHDCLFVTIEIITVKD